MAKFNVGLVEYRVKREERRIAKYDLKKQQVDLEKVYAQVTDGDTLLARTIQRVVKVLATMLAVIVVAGCIDGAVKEYFDQKNITDCERAVAAAGVIANCSTGVIGKTTEDGK